MISMAQFGTPFDFPSAITYKVEKVNLIFGVSKGVSDSTTKRMEQGTLVKVRNCIYVNLECSSLPKTKCECALTLL